MHAHPLGVVIELVAAEQRINRPPDSIRANRLMSDAVGVWLLPQLEGDLATWYCCPLKFERGTMMTKRRHDAAWALRVLPIARPRRPH